MFGAYNNYGESSRDGFFACSSQRSLRKPHFTNGISSNTTSMFSQLFSTQANLLQDHTIFEMVTNRYHEKYFSKWTCEFSQMGTTSALLSVDLKPLSRKPFFVLRVPPRSSKKYFLIFGCVFIWYLFIHLFSVLIFNLFLLKLHADLFVFP